MKDIYNANVVKTGEKPLEPAEARLAAISDYVAAATAALSHDPEIIHQPGLDPFMGGNVDELFAQRRLQLAPTPLVQPNLSVSSPVGSAEPATENMAYIEGLVSVVNDVPAGVSEISPAARSAVMSSTVVEDFNGFQEAA
jgi:hypothetical protein